MEEGSAKVARDKEEEKENRAKKSRMGNELREQEAKLASERAAFVCRAQTGKERGRKRGFQRRGWQQKGKSMEITGQP